MVYWLGGEWGVLQTYYNVINDRLPMDEVPSSLALS
jgi:hypothetical protein